MHIDQFDSFVEDFLGEKLERPVVIIGASKIDDLLFRILEKYLLNSKDPKDDDLLKGDHPISTFSSRIKLCYRLGIIDNDLFKILDQTRKIRNICAHSIEFDTKKEPIRNHIAEIKKILIIRDSFLLTKKRFFNDSFSGNINELQCILVTICVILEAIQATIKKTDGIKETLMISTK
jgi:hypothetical protein